MRLHFSVKESAGMLRPYFGLTLISFLHVLLPLKCKFSRDLIVGCAAL